MNLVALIIDDEVQIRRLLRPDGFLFLGAAETTMTLDASFERMQYERAGCYRLAA